jgi:hypothetical protein
MGITRAFIGLFGLLALASCGAPSDGSPATVVSDSTAGTTAVPSTAPAAGEATTLQLCSDVPDIETAVIGNNPTGGGFDPVFHGVLLTYAHEHEDTFGGMWLDREANGTFVLAFTDDPSAHRQALGQRRPSADDVHAVEPMPTITDDRPIGEWDVAFDVVQVLHTEAALVAAAGEITGALSESGLPNLGTGADIMRNRVSLHPAQPLTIDEAASLATAIAAVAPIEMICLDGTIVEARPEPIAPGTPLDVIVLPDAGGTYPPDTDVQCGGVRFTLGDLQSRRPVDDAGLQAVVDGWVGGAGGTGWPADGWFVLSASDDAVTLANIADDGMLVINAEMGRNGWIWAGAAGGGPCDVARRLPEGLGDVDWVLDPAFAAPDATTTEVHVLATETACAGGADLGERLLGPQVVETAADVRIVFAAIPQAGDATCPSNPPTAVTITLAQPLGDRVLVDGLSVGPLLELLPDE